MTYSIVYAKTALKFLKKQPPEQQRRLVQAIHKLPFTGDRKAMVGVLGEYRLRVGDYRVLYSVENDVFIIHILRIGNRGDVYK